MATLVSPRFLIHVAVAALLASMLVWVQPSMAVMAPSTLADRAPVQAGQVTTDFPIDYVGVFFDAPGVHGGEQGHDHAAFQGAVRFSHDGVWSAWTPLQEDGAQAEGRWTSALVPAAGATAYQVRGLPAAAVDAQAVAINTTDGPLEQVGQRPVGSAAAAATQCVTRAAWGADETLRGDADLAFHAPQALTVHHTVTANDDPDPAATVRAIYRYHAVDNGWGDIGYQYLVDAGGAVYEGRWSGTASTSCADFAHEEGGERVVTGAHTGGWNSGNVGVALLGDFTGRGRDKGGPTAAAMDGLESLLADLSVRHGLDPLAEITYVNPVSAETRVVQTISGHRDYLSTACPGELLYAQLPAVRTAVAERMAVGDPGTDPEPDPEPTAGVHVSDLDGTATEDRNRWTARVTVTVVDDSSTPVAGATVSGSWTTGSSVSCTTGADGTCTVQETAGRKDSTLGFAVSGVAATDLAYVAADNTDPDGDSDGTTITVVRAG